MDKPIDLNDMPLRREGGIIRASVPPIVERDPREAVVPMAAPYSWQAQLHTAALNRLAEAIDRLTEAIAHHGIPRAPVPDPPAEGSPGPAKGLITQVRPTPDHRNPNARSSFGFAPVKAETGDTEL